MSDFGFAELLVVLAVVVVIIGPERCLAFIKKSILEEPADDPWKKYRDPPDDPPGPPSPPSNLPTPKPPKSGPSSPAQASTDPKRPHPKVSATVKEEEFG